MNRLIRIFGPPAHVSDGWGGYHDRLWWQSRGTTKPMARRTNDMRTGGASACICEAYELEKILLEAFEGHAPTYPQAWGLHPMILFGSPPLEIRNSSAREVRSGTLGACSAVH